MRQKLGGNTPAIALFPKAQFLTSTRDEDFKVS
jgi:hypothetical protein